jgi:hypothetical protein
MTPRLTWEKLGTPLFSYIFVEAKYNDLFGGGEWEVKEI